MSCKKANGNNDPKYKIESKGNGMPQRVLFWAMHTVTADLWTALSLVWSPLVQQGENTLLALQCHCMHWLFCAQRNWALHFMPVVNVCSPQSQPMACSSVFTNEHWSFLIPYHCASGISTLIYTYMWQKCKTSRNVKKYTCVCAKNGSICSASGIYLSSSVSYFADITQLN